MNIKKTLQRGYEAVPSWLRRSLGIIFVAFVGVLLGVQLAGSGTYQIGPLDVEMAVQPAFHGESRIEVPPLGSITIDSHDAPARLNARISQLDEEKTREIIEEPTRLEEQSNEAVDDVNSAVADLVWRAAVTAVLVATLLGLLLFRQFAKALLTGGVALAIVAGTLGAAWVTWQPRNIQEPRYEGLLTNVPAVIGDAKSIYERYGQYRGDLIKIITNFSRVYANLSNLPAYEADPDTIRVLHISDLHLNPTSFGVIKPITEQFAIDVVVDTGDITDWSTDLENQYATNISTLKVPYLFVRGNHDRQATADVVAAQPNAVVLENSVHEVAGLRFAGIGDPRFTPDKGENDLARQEKQVIDADKQLDRTIKSYNRSHAKPVDVAMIHDPVGAKELADSCPLVLAGHKHNRSTKDLDDDTLLRVEGSTGARGLRGLYTEGEAAPLDMSVLYFSTEGKLQAYDEITISGPGQAKISLDRKIVEEKK